MDEHEVSFRVSQDDDRLIEGCVGRALIHGMLRPTNESVVMAMMDLSAAKAQGCPIDFLRLLLSPDSDFRHDMRGIFENIDRVTGMVGNCFVPRCARGLA